MALDLSLKITDIANFALTTALVITTIYYAKKTRDMAIEMEKTRKVQLLPKLRLSINQSFPMTYDPALANIGPGAALDVNVLIKFGDAETRTWKSSLMLPGEQQVFSFPEIDGRQPDISRQIVFFKKVVATGTFKDIFGDEHTIDDLVDLNDYHAVRKAAGTKFSINDLHGIRLGVEEISSYLQDLSETVNKPSTVQAPS